MFKILSDSVCTLIHFWICKYDVLDKNGFNGYFKFTFSSIVSPVLLISPFVFHISWMLTFSQQSQGIESDAVSLRKKHRFRMSKRRERKGKSDSYAHVMTYINNDVRLGPVLWHNNLSFTLFVLQPYSYSEHFLSFYCNNQTYVDF